MVFNTYTRYELLKDMMKACFFYIWGCYIYFESHIYVHKRELLLNEI